MLTAAAAAKILEVASATIRNWHRSGLLPAAALAPLRFERDAVLELRRQLRAGEVNRLKGRANKRHAKHRGRPSLPVAEAFRRLLLEAPRPRGLRSARRRWLELALGQAVAAGEAADAAAALAGDFRRAALRRLFAAWQTRLRGAEPDPARIAAFAACLARQGAPAYPGGAAIELLSSTGERSRHGTFFTPPETVEAIAAELGGQAGDTVLDPACGCGDFLLAFLRRGSAAAQLHGFDRHPDAADFARLNLLLADRDATTIPDIRCLDALKVRTAGRFDLVVGNPPWGGDFDRRAAARRWPDRGQVGDSFAAFIHLAADLVRPGGRVCFLVPESLLGVRRHRDCQSFLREHTSSLAARRLGRIFSGVMSPAVRLDFTRPGEKTAAGRTDDGCRFAELLLSLPHRTLEKQADFLLGIVTGDNAAFLHPVPAPGLEPVWRGSGVMPYRFGPPAGYLRFTPALFHQTAPEPKYRAPEKLVYRFIGGRLLFARDTAGRLMLNSANALIPRLPGLGAARLAAWFNSHLANAFYRRRFGGLKILRWHLEAMPVPDFLADGLPPEFDVLVAAAEAGEEDGNRIDELLFEAAAQRLGLAAAELKNLTFSASDDIFICLS